MVREQAPHSTFYKYLLLVFVMPLLAACPDSNVGASQDGGVAATDSGSNIIGDGDAGSPMADGGDNDAGSPMADGGDGDAGSPMADGGGNGAGSPMADGGDNDAGSNDDAGANVSDGGRPEPDSGVPQMDAGTNPVDSGSIHTDGGRTDSGAPVTSDAGSPDGGVQAPSDAGSTDAGMSPCDDNGTGFNLCGEVSRWTCTVQSDGTASCTDVDECEVDSDGTNACGLAAYWTCTNLEGAEPWCDDMDECADTGSGTNACGLVDRWICINNEGEPPQCDDVDECEVFGDATECGSVFDYQCTNQQGAAPLCEAIICGNWQVDTDANETCDDGLEGLEDQTDGCAANCRLARPRYCVDTCNPAGTLADSGFRAESVVYEANAIDSNFFGSSVAIDGNLIAVGTYQTTKEIGVNDWSGTFSLFEKNMQGQWAPQDVLSFPPGIMEWDFPSGFGANVAMDNSIIASGAPDAYAGDFLGNVGEGLAIAFTRDTTGAWSRHLLENPDAAANAIDGWDSDYGAAIAVSGNRVAVGALFTAFNPTRPGHEGGAVYLFQWSGTQWFLEHTFYAPEGNEYEGFGQSVSLSGNQLLVGSPYIDDPEDAFNNPFIGRAFLFEQSPSGWEHTHSFEEPTPTGYTYFGEKVALDGDRVIIGAPSANVGGPRVWSTTRDSDGIWAPLSALPEPETWGYPSGFGHSIAIDGDLALLGAIGGGGELRRAYLYSFDENGTWIYEQVIEPDLEDIQQFQDTGWAVDVSDGTLVVGAPGDDGEDNSVMGAYGAAYIFSESPSICYDTGTCLCVDGYTGPTCSVAP